MRSPATDPHRPWTDLTLTTEAPRISVAEAAVIAGQIYGVSGRAQRQAGEKDDNFLIRSDAGDYFLKLVHPAEPPQVTDLCTKVLLKLEPISDLPVQKVVPTRTGEAIGQVQTGAGGTRRMRLTTYLHGRLAKTVPDTPALRAVLGRTLARLGQELRNFRHPISTRPLLWDLAQANLLRPLLDDLTGRFDCAELTAALDRFDTDARPRLSALRRQFIHNDLSGDNVLVADDGVSVTGIIDFGDVITTQLVNDVGIAVANLLDDSDDPIAPGVDLIRAYHDVEPLTVPELELIYDLARLRIVARIIITEWRALRYPENRDYILRNTPGAWTQLRAMPESGACAATQRLMAACGLG